MSEMENLGLRFVRWVPVCSYSAWRRAMALLAIICKAA
jgi:hypothetical protein